MNNLFFSQYATINISSIYLCTYVFINLNFFITVPMCTKRAKTYPENGNVENILASPDCVTLTSFVLKRARKNGQTGNSEGFLDASKEKVIQMDATSGLTDVNILKRSLRCQPRILLKPGNYSSEESESEQFYMVISSKFDCYYFFTK